MAVEHLPTFGDMPDARDPIEEIERKLSGLPPEPEPQPAPQPQVQQIPVPVPVQDPNSAAYMQRMAEWQSRQEREEFDRKQQEFWNQVYTPPELPEDPDELLTDGKKLQETLRARDEWTKQVIQRTVEPWANRSSELEQELQESRAARAELAYDKARYLLHQNGIPEDQNIWNGVENLLRANPQNYWKMRTDPRAMATAYRMMRDNFAQQGYTLPAQQQQAPATARPGWNGQQGQQGFYKDDDVQKIERVLGVKFNNSDLNELYGGGR